MTRFCKALAARFFSVTCLAILGAVGNVALADNPQRPTVAPAGSASGTGEQAGEEASHHFKRGLQLFDDGDYALALVEFERAYQLAPNYRALYNIGLVDIQLGRYAAAARVLESYLHDGGEAISADRRGAVLKMLGELRLRTATVEVTLNVPNAEVTLDGKVVESARLRGPMLIDAGEHSLRATAPGHKAVERNVTLAGEDHVAIRLELPVVATVAAPAREVTAGRGRTLFWPGVIATGVFATGAVVSGALMFGARSRLDALQQTPQSEPSSRERTASQVNTAAAFTDVFLGLAIVSGGISTYLSLTESRSSKLPTLAISPQQISLSGTF